MIKIKFISIFYDLNIHQTYYTLKNNIEINFSVVVNPN